MTIETYGSYQLIKRLAMGGMAEIYLARQKGPEGFEKLLVVKRILPHLGENAEFVQMFLDEARIAAKLNHPNIVQIFNLGAQDDSYFIAMEYIHGEDLRRVWKRAERSGQLIPVPLVCRVLIEACAGLDYAHKRTDASGRPLNIVHRDISPQNILLTFEGRVKVVDFGIAKAADQATVTRSGVLKGKYSYMSPEQAAGRKVDCRSDIFALGVVLYELLTGIRLFKRTSDMATLQAVAECKVAPPSQVNPRVPAELDAIVMKALAKEPDARYAEAVQLQLALEDWLVAHRLASSTAHVATFMQELYAARLAEEARLGDVLLEESESAAPPSARSVETQVARQRPPEVDNAPTMPLEATELQALGRNPRRTSSRPSVGGQRGTSERRALESRRTPEPRRPAEPEPEPEPRSTSSRQAVRPSRARQALPAPPPPRGSHRLAVGLVAAGLLVGLALVAWWMLAQPGQPGVVPRPVAAVPPAQVPPAPTGAVGVVEESTPPAAEVKPPPQPVRIQLTLLTEPAKAQVEVNGRALGQAPVEISALVGEELAVKVEAARYSTLSHKVLVGEGPKQVERLVLEPLPGTPRREERRPEVSRTASDPRSEERTALVRFVVKPTSVWADVHCNGKHVGQTPFRDKRMPIGSYECRFSHPERGTRTRHVDVKLNSSNLVVVDFDA